MVILLLQVPHLCDFEASPPCADVRGSDNISPGCVSDNALSPQFPFVDTPSPSIATLPKLSLDISPTPPPKTTKPSADDDETSQDSGVNMDGDLAFKFPQQPASRPHTLRMKDFCFSPGTFMSSPVTPTSPQSLSFSSPDPDLLVDDGFHDELDENDQNIPAGMSQLLTGRMLSTKPEKSVATVPEFTPNRSALPKYMVSESKGPARRGLFRSPSAPKLLTSLRRQSSLEESDLAEVTESNRATKRVERDDDVIVRPLLKRRKSVFSVTEDDVHENQENEPPVRKPTPKLQVILKSILEIICLDLQYLQMIAVNILIVHLFSYEVRY